MQLNTQDHNTCERYSSSSLRESLRPRRSRSSNTYLPEECSRRKEESTYQGSNIEALSKVVSMLVEKVRIFKSFSSTSYQPEKKVQSMLPRHVSISPEPEDSRWCDKSKLLKDALKWTISHTYISEDDFNQ
ncbi:11333_t:CDS:2, partial [Funneliformis caledonium]